MTASVDSARPAVVLIGPPGAGKSTVGRRLARVLNQEFTDIDTVIEKTEGRSCAEIFAQDGEAYFREREAQTVAEALTKPGVVALGGGAVSTDSTRELLHDHTVVLVDVDEEVGIARTIEASDKASRPMLDGDDPAQRYRNLVAARRPCYREVADFRSRTDQRTPQQVVADILGFLESL